MHITILLLCAHCLGAGSDYRRCDPDHQAIDEAGTEHRRDHPGAALDEERQRASRAQSGQGGRKVDAAGAGRDDVDAHPAACGAVRRPADARRVVITVVAASGPRICAVGGSRRVESARPAGATLRATRRTVRSGSSVITVPTPTSTASHAARSACDMRRSASPLIHLASPVDVAMRPSSV